MSSDARPFFMRRPAPPLKTAPPRAGRNPRQPPAPQVTKATPPAAWYGVAMAWVGWDIARMGRVPAWVGVDYCADWEGYCADWVGYGVDGEGSGVGVGGVGAGSPW